MANTFDEKSFKKQLAAQYESKLGERVNAVKKLLTEDQNNFLRNVTRSKIYAEFEEALKNPTLIVSKYIKKNFAWFFENTAIANVEDVILYFADIIQEYPYSHGSGRRSFRSTNKDVYAWQIAQMIKRHAIDSYTIDAPLDQILNRTLPNDAQAFLEQNAWRGCGYSAWQVAYALDHHDVKVEEAVRRILTEANSSSQMTTELIRGILISHREDFYELLGKLLLAARLQEGLRQSICENADFGTKAGFISLLKVINENNLVRFSSVKRAIGCWLGFSVANFKDFDRITQKSLDLMLQCLVDEKQRSDYLKSEDAMQLYIALWSYGVDDISVAKQKVEELVQCGTNHQIWVAGYFTYNTEDQEVRHQFAKPVIKQHYAKEELLAVWLVNFLPRKIYTIHKVLSENYKAFGQEKWFDNQAEIKTYYQIFQTVYASFNVKTKTFTHSVFPWFVVEIKKSALAEVLCTLAALAEDITMIDECCALIKECNADSRSKCFQALLSNPTTLMQRQTVLYGLVDKESFTRAEACKIVSQLELSTNEYHLIEEHLRFKAADIRENITGLLLQQNDDDLIKSIERLLKHKTEEVRLGGLDIILQLKKGQERNNLVGRFEQLLTTRLQSDKLPAKEKILLESLVTVEELSTKTKTLFLKTDKYIPNQFSAEYMEKYVQIWEVYFPDSQLPNLIRGKKVGKTSNEFSKNLICACTDLISLSQLIEAHKTDSFVNRQGETMLVGNVQYYWQFADQNQKLPLLEVWREWLKQNQITNGRLMRAWVLYYASRKQNDVSKNCAPIIHILFGRGFESGRELPYDVVMKMILDSLVLGVIPDKKNLAIAFAYWFAYCLPEDMVMVDCDTNKDSHIKEFGKAHVLAWSQLYVIYSWLVATEMKEYQNMFPLAVACKQRCVTALDKLLDEERVKEPDWVDNNYNHLIKKMQGTGNVWNGPGYFGADINSYLYAAYYGVITEAQLMEYLCRPENLSETLHLISSVAVKHIESIQQNIRYGCNSSAYINNTVKGFLNKKDPTEDDAKIIEFVFQIYQKIIPVVVEDELWRGDSARQYSSSIARIVRIYGVKYFTDILFAMGNDNFARSDYSVRYNRKTTLAHLLSVCVPQPDDTVEKLREALNGKQIATKRLIEAALFSPEWIPLVGQYLGIKNFEAVCYYFMAHMDERFDDKRKAIIAKYTPLTVDELNLGAFDVDWFRSAYNMVSPEEFEIFYDAAKYITNGVKHTRARKYADAALGKLDIMNTQQAIIEKRNKDLLMAYAIIPLQSDEDLCQRYLYIQKFLKESKQFGSQRALSESKAAEMALTNLAVNAGYADTMRLTLRMEVKVIDDNQAFFKEQMIEGVSIKIILDDNGKASLVCVKNGKRLNNVPAALKKHEFIVQMTAFTKTLTEQYRRTRTMLEQAMEDETVFTFEELTALFTHPVVYPMLKNLVFVSGDNVGFIHEKGLSDYTDKVQKLNAKDEVKIAHPFMLYKQGCWRDYQKYLFDQQIVQPFRQVFRELYVMTAEEKNLQMSRRYAGNQIQPAKTVATLKTRRWVADVEDGLQKIYYKENIIAKIYALADWFSPSDIECPTLETVCFYDRKTGKSIKISDVPSVIFSEVMRDVDLAVSVAHAGGVDPETSHSTIEMRAAILSFVLPLFRINNVKIEGQYAIIGGKIAEYSVHLGSGVVHQIGGSMIPVLPVHSQQRGKIFLPFIDDDPKTAEVIAKVLLFAEDNKIQDPMILSNIIK